MLLGPPGQGAPNAEMAPKYREELLESIKKIIEKPI